MYFNFCFWFFDWYPDRNYEFWNRKLKICPKAAWIKKYKSIIKKKKKNNDKIVSLANSKLYKIKALIDSSISHNEFV